MLCIELEKFCPEYIHFKNSTTNTIIPNGSFRYINYINYDLTLSTVYLILNKDSEITLLTNIETEFLKISSKIKQYKFHQILSQCKINKKMVLKITGIWESSKYCGVSFKVIHLP